MSFSEDILRNIDTLDIQTVKYIFNIYLLFTKIKDELSDIVYFSYIANTSSHGKTFRGSTERAELLKKLREQLNALTIYSIDEYNPDIYSPLHQYNSILGHHNTMIQDILLFSPKLSIIINQIYNINYFCNVEINSIECTSLLWRVYTNISKINPISNVMLDEIIQLHVPTMIYTINIINAYINHDNNLYKMLNKYIKNEDISIKMDSFIKAAKDLAYNLGTYPPTNDLSWSLDIEIYNLKESMKNLNDYEFIMLSDILKEGQLLLNSTNIIVNLSAMIET